MNVAFFQKPKRGEGIEQDGRRPQVGAEFFGQLFGQEGLAAEGGPHVEFGGGPDHAGGAEAVHQIEDLLAIEMRFRHDGVSLTGAQASSNEPLPDETETDA